MGTRKDRVSTARLRRTFPRATHNGRAHTIRNTRNRSRGIPSHTRYIPLELFRVGRQAARVFRRGRDGSRTGEERRRAAVVSQPLPGGIHVFNVRGREGGEGRPAREPPGKVGNDRGDLGLLEHHFGDPDLGLVVCGRHEGKGLEGGGEWRVEGERERERQKEGDTHREGVRQYEVGEPILYSPQARCHGPSCPRVVAGATDQLDDSCSTDQAQVHLCTQTHDSNPSCPHSKPN